MNRYTRAVLVFVIMLSAFGLGLVDTLTAQAQNPNHFYVAPDGRSGGNGSINSPWDLRTAFSHPNAVKPGDIIWLRGGRYGNGGSTLFVSRLEGTQDKPITVRQYPGERATIDGGVDAAGEWVTFWGFEIMNSGPRTVRQSQRPPGLDLNGRGHSAINMFVHNTGNVGIGFWKPVGAGAEIYGSLIWGNGLYQTDGGGSPSRPWMRGSGIYTQNQDGTRYIRETMTFRNLSNGIKLYAVGSHADGFHLQGNVSFENKDYNLVAGARNNPIERLVIRENFTYRDTDDNRRNVRLGLENTQQEVTVDSNYFVGGESNPVFDLYRFRNFTVRNNTIIGVDKLVEYTQAGSSDQWNNNRYFGGDSRPFDNGSNRDFSQWRSRTGFDRNSNYNGSYPGNVDIFVRPNEYENGRGHVVVYNWGDYNTVNVNLSRILQPGEDYEIYDIENVFGSPVASGTYNGNNISLPMNLTRTSEIVGETYRNIHREHTPPEFNVFLVLCPSCQQSMTPGNVSAAPAPSLPTAEPTREVVQEPQPTTAPVQNQPDTAPTEDMRVVSFTLVDAGTNRDIRTLSSEDTLVLSELPTRLSVRANTRGQVGSVAFNYNGDNSFRVENSAPFTIAGDNRGDYWPVDFPRGEHTLTAAPHAERGARGAAGEALSINLSIIDREVVSAPPTATQIQPTPVPVQPTAVPVQPTQQPAAPPADDETTTIQVLSFTLVNADTNRDIRPLNNGDAIVLAELPSQVSIRANTAGNVGSVVFSYRDLPGFRTENVAPYTIAGDSNGNYRPMDMRLGQNILSAMPYTERNGDGAAGEALTIGFTVVRERQIAQQPQSQVQPTQVPPTSQPSRPDPTDPPPMQVENVGDSSSGGSDSSGSSSGGSSSSGSGGSSSSSGGSSSSGSGGSSSGGSSSSGSGGSSSGDNLRVVSFTLINADNGQELGTIEDGMTIPSSRLPRNVNIRADVRGPVESVVFEFTGKPRGRKENEAPYMLAGNRGDDINPIEGTSRGRHTLKARAYARDEGEGRSSAEYSVTFTLGG